MNDHDPFQRVQDIFAQIAEQQRQEDARAAEFRRRYDAEREEFRRRHEAEMEEIRRKSAEEEAKREKRKHAFDAEMAEFRRQRAEEEAKREKRKQAFEAEREEFRRRHEAEMAEFRRQSAEEDAKRQQKFEAEMADIHRGFDRAQQTLNNVSRAWGVFGNNEGERVEDEFFFALDESKHIGDVRLDKILQRLKSRYEYDLVGVNGTAVFVGEIKRKLSGDDVRRFAENRLPHFAAYFPYYATDRQIYGMVGGLQILPEAVEAAEECGMFVLRLKNKSLIVENNATARPIN